MATDCSPDKVHTEDAIWQGALYIVTRKSQPALKNGGFQERLIPVLPAEEKWISREGMWGVVAPSLSCEQPMLLVVILLYHIHVWTLLLVYTTLLHRAVHYEHDIVDIYICRYHHQIHWSHILCPAHLLFWMRTCSIFILFVTVESDCDWQAGSSIVTKMSAH